MNGTNNLMLTITKKKYEVNDNYVLQSINSFSIDFLRLETKAK